ncbi:MAG: MerR family transcriptional regulator [Coriobacteriales bacterium]|jgi:DNA-binding transcriptional MerR regulator|nr:MerR family transcriptional regulator [Coriobacteriales bacterium]
MNNEEPLLVSVKEFSDFTGVKESILRYYDAIDLFKPSERGANNYRYYSLSQIQTIKLIETLRSLKVPLKRIKKIMDERSPETMAEVLAHYELEMNNELKALQESFALVHMLRTLMQSALPRDEAEMTIRFSEEMRIALGPINDFQPSEENYHRVFSNYYRIARSLRVNLGYPIGGYFDTVEEFLKTPAQPKRYFSLDPSGLEVKRAGNYLMGYTRGGYGTMNDLPTRVDSYLKEHDIAQAGPVYQIYILNEVSIQDTQDYLQQISIWMD